MCDTRMCVTHVCACVCLSVCMHRPGYNYTFLYPGTLDEEFDLLGEIDKLGMQYLKT